jgi:kumamolisin
LLTVAAIASVAITAGQAQSRPPLTRHVRDVVANGQAKSLGRLPANQSMRIVMVLPHRNEAALLSALRDMYDPTSTSYHQYLTVEQFTERYGPSQEDYDAVKSFAATHGLTVVATSRNRMNVDVTGRVSDLEAALHVHMGVYQHPTENRTFYSPDREPTPDLAFPLHHISGLDNYSIPKPLLAVKSANATPLATTGSCPSASFCGSDMRAAYYGGTLTGTGQSVGLLEYAGTDLADLNTYFTNVHQTNNVPITLLSTDGTSTSCVDSGRPRCDDTEQTLDMTQAISMAPGLSSLVMYVGSTDSAMFNAMATASPLNAQLSSSWTWRPADPSTDDPYFEEFAMQGQNLFQAAGDSGAWTSGSEIWPSDSPFVTSVGGTDLTTTAAGGAWASESAWVDGGGGISPNAQAIPSWQTAAAAGCASCSKTLRNGPDVSANADFSFYVCADQKACSANSYGGTSFAAPMWAGYLALTNQQALLNGNTVLGFINPMLYSIYAGSSYNTDFHDVTTGSNGFSATTGYDLATGLGSPNGSGLLNSLAGGSSGSPSFTIAAAPKQLTVAQGATGKARITTTIAGGFDAAISLSATGEGAKQSVAFSVNPIPAPGGGSSIMTVTVGATATVGKHLVTITGTGGSQTETATMVLNIVAAGQ